MLADEFGDEAEDVGSDMCGDRNSKSDTHKGEARMVFSSSAPKCDLMNGTGEVKCPFLVCDGSGKAEELNDSRLEKRGAKTIISPSSENTTNITCLFNNQYKLSILFKLYNSKCLY